MRIEILRGKRRIETTLGELFDALRSVARSDAEAEAVFECMVNEGRVRVLAGMELARAA
jgi:hypothetical protein